MAGLRAEYLLAAVWLAALCAAGCSTAWEGDDGLGGDDDDFGDDDDDFGDDDDAFGDDDDSEPAITWVAVGTSENHSCGFTNGGNIRCWGGNFSGELDVPQGVYLDFSVGNDVTCVLDGTVLSCWGDNELSASPAGSYSDVGAGRLYIACALQSDGDPVCWGGCAGGLFGGEFDLCIEPSGPFVELTTGQYHACARRADGSVTCWGSGYDGELDVPPGSYTQIAAGAQHTCGLRSDGTVSCWGVNVSGQSSPPDGQFEQIAAGWHHSCGVRADGSIDCWGREDASKYPTEGNWTYVATGEDHSCAVSVDGDIECWGANESGQTGPIPPPL